MKGGLQVHLVLRYYGGRTDVHSKVLVFFLEALLKYWANSDNNNNR